ncbi:hypothetical protein B0H10DRAFT_2083923, partial [Mycena sp. CBHHK59/15]
MFRLGASVTARVTARSLALSCSNDPYFDRRGPSFSAAFCSLHSCEEQKKINAASTPRTHGVSGFAFWGQELWTA